MTLVCATVTVAVLSMLTVILVLGLMAAELEARTRPEDGQSVADVQDSHGVKGRARTSMVHRAADALSRGPRGEEGAL